jgi:hypothetical protein
MVLEIPEVYVKSLYSRKNWYETYHREFNDTFIPRFRKFYYDLRDYSHVAKPDVRDRICDMCALAMAHLWRYELYSQQYSRFLVEFNQYIRYVAAQYDAAVVGKKIGPWQHAGTRSFPSCS